MPHPNDPRGPTMFHQATVTNNGTMYATVNDQRDTLDHLHLLHSEVAPNAILNAGGRADVVRCHPGTRERVIVTAEDWMEVGYREDRRIFWLSGAAGAGKSAIVQTIAENCLKRKMVMANFFFFRADGSRNHSGPVVATLLHQLIEQLPDLASPINEIILKNRLIFKKSLHDQFRLLLDAPIRSLWQGLQVKPPIILLIDGLDECDSLAYLNFKTTVEQTTLLKALHDLVRSSDSPFIGLVASRIESHIRMAFNQIGLAATSIDLNNDNEADRDIRRYVTAELANVRRTHPLGVYMDASWPEDCVIDFIVEKASGQFIYPAVVIRFLANSPQSPGIAMQMVQQIRPVHKRSPFSEIDAIYAFILSRAEHWESASEIFALSRFSGVITMAILSLFYSENDVPSYFCDLTSILHSKITKGVVIITTYHASFSDFIHSRQRAGRFHIDLEASAHYFAPQLILATSDFDMFRVAMGALDNIRRESDSLTYALTHLALKPWDVGDWWWTPQWKYSPENWGKKSDFLVRIYWLYARRDPEVYAKIFACMKRQGWIPNEVLLEDALTSLEFRDSDVPAVKPQSDSAVKVAMQKPQSVFGETEQPQTTQSHAYTQQLPPTDMKINKPLPASTITRYREYLTYDSLHRYLAPHGITWDVRDPPAAITTWSGGTISSLEAHKPTCAPPKSSVNIVLATASAWLPWSVQIDKTLITLEDVFTAVYTTLRVNITPRDWDLLGSPEDKAAAAQAYQTRYRRCDDQGAYQEEKRAGMKRVDFLMDCYRWAGLEKNNKQDTACILRFK